MTDASTFSGAFPDDGNPKPDPRWQPHSRPFSSDDLHDFLRDDHTDK